jgi:GNAT superfamily N-acetyltransferase
LRVSEVIVRPTRPEDVEEILRVQMAAFGQSLEGLTDQQRDRSRRRHRHFIEHDPAGTWVATVDNRVVGNGEALRREGLWGLSLLVVDPDAQSHGIGRQLLDATLSYAEGCDRAIILSSDDPRAIRAYATSGFVLFPQMVANGKPALDAAPRSMSRVRSGSVADSDFANDLDRSVRGAGRGPDHAFIADTMTMYVVDDADGRGYAYRRDGEIYLLASTDDDTATALLWHCLRCCDELGLDAGVFHLNAQQQWALEVCFAARLTVKPDGPAFWRGATPPPSYLPSGAFL